MVEKQRSAHLNDFPRRHYCRALVFVSSERMSTVANEITLHLQGVLYRSFFFIHFDP